VTIILPKCPLIAPLQLYRFVPTQNIIALGGPIVKQPNYVRYCGSLPQDKFSEDKRFCLNLVRSNFLEDKL
jgi:hypothetical protein